MTLKPTEKLRIPSLQVSTEPLDDILATVGHTPTIALRRLLPNAPINLYGKMEGFNPGGSIKDRPAKYIIEQALESGEIGPGTTIVEASSGNFAIGLARVCSYYGLKFLCLTDKRITPLNLKILEAFGAEVEILQEPDPVTGEFLPALFHRVQALLKEIPGAFWPNQHNNFNNPAAHHITMSEIHRALDGKVDYLFCATSTCGTLRGCAEYVKEQGLKTRVIAVDALGSVIFGSQKQKRHIPGHGAGRIPGIFSPNLADEVMHVNGMDAVIGCRTLLQREAILAGGSSGGLVRAVMRVARQLKPDSNCVMILCDRGDRYLDTIYCDDWVKQHFANTPEYEEWTRR